MVNDNLVDLRERSSPHPEVLDPANQMLLKANKKNNSMKEIKKIKKTINNSFLKTSQQN